jgi:hypothetical protein
MPTEISQIAELPGVSVEVSSLEYRNDTFIRNETSSTHNVAGVCSLSSPPSPRRPAQQFFSLIYLDTNLLKRFHSEVNLDDRASVPRWAGDRRTLRFSTPLDAPALIRRLVGTAVVHVVEEQVVRRLPGGGVEIESNPEPQIPGAANFSSLATLAMRDLPGGGGCRLEGRVTCAATGPYGLASTLESFMAESAAKSLRKFIAFCQAHIESLQQSGSMQVALAASAAAIESATLTAAAEPAVAPEEFFEAEEPQLPVPLEPGTATLEVLALYLQYISRTGDQTVAVLSSMDARLAQLEAAAAASAEAQKQQPSLSQRLWCSKQALYAAGGAVTGGLVAWLYCRRRTS